jgi:uncharacterized membrane protein YwaF
MEVGLSISLDQSSPITFNPMETCEAIFLFAQRTQQASQVFVFPSLASSAFALIKIHQPDLA